MCGRYLFRTPVMEDNSFLFIFCQVLDVVTQHLIWGVFFLTFRSHSSSLRMHSCLRSYFPCLSRVTLTALRNAVSFTGGRENVGVAVTAKLP